VKLSGKNNYCLMQPHAPATCSIATPLPWAQPAVISRHDISTPGCSRPGRSRQCGIRIPPPQTLARR
jgi:hypothetical protein